MFSPKMTAAIKQTFETFEALVLDNDLDDDDRDLVEAIFVQMSYLLMLDSMVTESEIRVIEITRDVHGNVRGVNVNEASTEDP